MDSKERINETLFSKFRPDTVQYKPSHLNAEQEDVRQPKLQSAAWVYKKVSPFLEEKVLILQHPLLLITASYPTHTPPSISKQYEQTTHDTIKLQDELFHQHRNIAPGAV